MIKAKIFIGLTIAEIILLAGFFFFSASEPQTGRTIKPEAAKELVNRLLLTDFAIWTEARYTRHPSQTDFFTPFQEFPSALEHFPAGSVIAPVFTARENQ